MNGPDWASFNEKIRDAHVNTFEFPTVTIYNFDGGYDPDTGETGVWEEDDGTEVRAEPTIPQSPRMMTGADGQDVRVRRRFRIRDDTGVALNPVGTPNARPSEVEHDDQRWLLVDVMDEDNGLLVLSCTQV